MPIPPVAKLKTKFTNTDEMENLRSYIRMQCDYLKEKTRMFRESLLPKWEKIYKGKPEIEKKTFPWPEASNLVIQLAATHADELLSRVMSIYQTEQLYVAQILGDFERGIGTDQSEILEKFMADQALDPNVLDLYRVEQVFFSSAIRYGTGIVKTPFRYEKEQVYTGSATTPFQEKVVFDGPRPENVPLNKFLIDTQRPTIRHADFLVHITTYKEWQLKNLIESASEADSFWDKAVLEEIQKGGADRAGPDIYQQTQEQPKGMTNQTPSEIAGEWDIYECWLVYNYGGKRYRVIAHFHEKTGKIAGGLFNPYPNSQVPIEDAKLAYDDDQYYGYGFMEMLEAYQREVSTIHNQRIDNRNLANTGAMRVAPNSKLASIIQIYPGVMIPGTKDEVEPLALGNTTQPISTEDEQITLSLAKDRSGVDPAIGGTGGGIVNQKRGIYSAQGTAIAMQQLNNRNNLRMSDMRSAHVRLGIKILDQYANFEVDPERMKRYGDKAPLLKQALENYRIGKLGLLIKPASASNNKELEKQNDMLLMQTMTNLQMQDMQMIASISTPNQTPDMIEYIVNCITAKNALFRRLVQSFEHPDVDRLAPLPEFIKKMRAQLNAAANGATQGTSGPAGPQAQGNNQGFIPGGGGSNLSSISQIPGGGSQGETVQ